MNTFMRNVLMVVGAALFAYAIYDLVRGALRRMEENNENLRAELAKRLLPKKDNVIQRIGFAQVPAEPTPVAN